MSKGKKKKRTLFRVLLISCCAFMIVLTFSVVRYVDRIAENRMGTKVRRVDAVVLDEEERAELVQGQDKPTPTVLPTKPPTPTPLPPPEVDFTEEYAHSGEFTEVCAYGKGVPYGMRYPSYEEEEGGAEIRKAAEGFLTQQLDKFGDVSGKECSLIIDYEDGAFGQLASVLFRAVREIDGETESESKLWIYNKKNKTIVDSSALFGKKAYEYAAGLVKQKEGKTPEVPEGEELFSSYLLTADGVKFFYEADAEERFVSVPYPAIHTYMAVTVGGTVVKETIRELDPEKPMIALTFDDGPHYQNTPRLLEILKENDVRATFFLLGSRLSWNGSAEAVELLVASGNEIASHTQNHEMLATLSREKLQKEISEARDKIFEMTGDYPTFLRAPYGNYNDTVKKYTQAPIILWNLDSEDWKSKDKDTIVAHVLEEAGNGKIVLMHDIHTFTVDAAEELIPKLKERGYQIVTVRELFYYKGVDPENGKVYHSSYN